MAWNRRDTRRRPTGTRNGPDDPPDHPTCRQCGKPLTAENRVFVQVFSRDPTLEAAFWRRSHAFCSAECGSHYQMGSEG